MSKKNKRDRGRRRIDVDHLQIARRELAKRNAKVALEHARLQHQESPDAESREVLERALLARAEQMHDHGNRESANALIGELDGLGTTVAEVASSLDRLRALLGVFSPRGDQAVGSQVQPPDDLAAVLADQAVLYPQRRSPAYTELNEQADLVREALRDVERGEDAAAVERLAAIGRKSPFADWRLFVRGLAAHYADEVERVEANWSRLDPQRAANRIATNLQVFSGRLKPENCPVDVGTGQRRLQYAVSGSPVVSQLESIRDHFQSGRVHSALSALRLLRQRNGQSRKRLIERLTDLLWKRLVAEEDERGMRQLVKAVPGPPLDPNWHRARALLWDVLDSSDMNVLEDLWTAYIGDLQQCGALSEDERRIAVSLVHRRLADAFTEAAKTEGSRNERDFGFWDEYDEEEGEEEREKYIEILQKQAEQHLRNALREHPLLLDAHRDLVALYQDADRPVDAIEAARQLLKHFPDHFDTLLWLANYFIEADMPMEAESYADQVSRLRPRDPAVRSLVWHQRMGMLRQLTRKRKFDQARERLNEAFAAPPSDVKPYTMDLLLATIEYKAKNSAAAETHLQAAVGKVQEPTVVWLMMHAYADRFSLGREVKNDFRDRFKAAIAKRPTSETAGHIAGFLRDFVVRRVKYSGLATHQRLVVNYLNRSTKLAWQHDDLRAVCEFLRHLTTWQVRGLRSKLTADGTRRFPGDPLFPYLHAKFTMQETQYRVDYVSAVKDLERALDWNKTSEYRLSEKDLDDAKQGLAAAQLGQDMMSSFMGRFAEFMGGQFDPYDDEEDDWDDEDDDDQSQGRSRGWTFGGRPQGDPSDSGKNQRFFPF